MHIRNFTKFDPAGNRNGINGHGNPVSYFWLLTAFGTQINPTALRQTQKTPTVPPVPERSVGGSTTGLVAVMVPAPAVMRAS